MSAPATLKFKPSSQALARVDAAALALRIGLATMWLSHSILLKLMTFGMAGFSGWLTSIGWPSVLAYPVVIAEVLGGLAILVGYRGALASLLLQPILLGALVIHAGNGWVFSSPNGGWEYPAFLMLASLVHMLLDDGRYALRVERRG